jgi:DNA-binding SARP family transcriptional activator
MIQPQTSDPGSAFTPIEQGLSYITQGYLIAGLELLRQAQQQLPIEQTSLYSALEALRQATSGYLHAEQRLHTASAEFADADRERRSSLEELMTLLRMVHPSSSQSQLSLMPTQIPTDQLLPWQEPACSFSPQQEMISQLPSSQSATLPALSITCFGHFSVWRAGPPTIPVRLCRNLKGQTILRYLLSRPDHQASMDMLMADLWPDEEADQARHKLQIAISALRCSLNHEQVQAPGGGYILCKDRIYQLNSDCELHTDIDEFQALYNAGCKAQNLTEAATLYERACQLYTGPFLVEDLYAEWSFMLREELSRMYLTMCSRLAEFHLERGNHETAMTWAGAILKIDRCDENAYQQLMRASAAAGKRSEALRCYQQCQQALAEELDVAPTSETQQLLQTILHGGY